MTTMNNRSYSYSPISNTLTVTAAFLKKASVLNSPEYQLLMQCRKDNPGVRIMPAERKSKPSNKSITFKQMEAYIDIFDDENKTLAAQFEKVKKMSKIQASPYKYVKVWFENQFPHYKDQVSFDEKGNIVFEGAAAAQEDQNAEDCTGAA